MANTRSTRRIPRKIRPRGRSLNGFVYREQYGIIVTCRDARHQRTLYNRFRRQGHECKVVVV